MTKFIKLSVRALCVALILFSFASIADVLAGTTTYVNVNGASVGLTTFRMRDQYSGDFDRGNTAAQWPLGYVNSWIRTFSNDPGNSTGGWAMKGKWSTSGSQYALTPWIGVGGKYDWGGWLVCLRFLSMLWHYIPYRKLVYGLHER